MKPFTALMVVYHNDNGVSTFIGAWNEEKSFRRYLKKISLSKFDFTVIDVQLQEGRKCTLQDHHGKYELQFIRLNRELNINI